MKEKKYYGNPASTIVKINKGIMIFFGLLAVVGIVLLVAPVAMYRVENSGIMDFLFDEFDSYTVMAVIAVVGLAVAFLSYKQVRRLTKLPVLEIDDDALIITNLNNGKATTYSFKDIERAEISEVNILGKKIPCVNIIPVEGAYEKLASRCKGEDRKRIDFMYKAYGAVEQIFEHLIDATASAAYEDIKKALDEYKASK